MRFSGDSPRAEAGSLMKVDGMLVGEAIVTESASVTTEADAAASCSTTGVQRIAVIKVKFPGTSPSLANSTLDGWMFGSSGMTVSNFWDENSYGAAWADGDVYPSGSDAWYTLDREYSCSESDALRNAALQAANGNVNFQNYQRAVIVFPKPSSGCSFAGRASIGCWVSSPDGNTISYALQVLTSMGTAQKAVQLTTHEGGHTLGLYHASTVDFGSDAVGPTNSSGTRDEYGDRYSSMGFWTDGHYAAPQKKQLGWLSPTSVNSAGTFTVAAFSNTSGIRALDIKRGSSGSQRIWLEYRRQLGEFNADPPAYPGNGALLHLGNGNSNSLLLDFTPSSAGGFLDATLESGQTWSDPYSDLSIQIGSATNSGLQVTVSYGVTPTCSTNPPTISVSPNSKSTNYPAAASYTVSVTNNDSSACGSSSYSMTSKALYDGSVTAEVSTSLNNTVLTIAPGSTAATTLVATPATQPPDARNYMVSAKAARSNPNQSAEDDAGLTVVPPLQCVTAAPVISLSPVSRTAEFPTGTTFTASLTNNDNSACSATSFSMSAMAQLGGQTAGNISTGIASSLSVAPGTTKTTTVTVTPTSVPASQSTYSITAKAVRPNPSQTVQASSNFTVTLAPACQPALPTVSLSPDSRSTEYPNPANFTLTVVNNDSSACSISSFSIGASATNVANAGVSSSLLSIGPGTSLTTIVTVTPTILPTAPTNHTVTASVSRSNPSQLVQDASLLVVSPPAPTCVLSPPSISVNPANGNTEFPNPVSYTVSLTNNDTAVCQSSAFSLTSNALFGGLPTNEVSAALANSGLTIAPGATASTVIVATPLVLPAQAKSYAVTAAASRVAQQGAAQGTVGLTVTPPPTGPPPPASTTVDVVISIIGSRGTVELDPLGIDCPGGCTTTIDANQWEPLTLTAIPSGNSCVQVITGCSASSGNTCTLSTAKNYEITVEFGRCTSVGGKTGGKGRVSRIAETTDATSTGRGRKR
jgi:M6 family metalloprotease-like protein